MQDPAIFIGSEVRINDPDAPLVNLTVAFKGASWTDPDSITLMVMQTLLGAWDKNASAGGPLFLVTRLKYWHTTLHACS